MPTSRAAHGRGSGLGKRERLCQLALGTEDLQGLFPATEPLKHLQTLNMLINQLTGGLDVLQGGVLPPNYTAHGFWDA